jgi:ectoine hydroxylase-related dioxygenase (phytanoyl-CoA dioxygenase family)
LRALSDQERGRLGRVVAEGGVPDTTEFSGMRRRFGSGDEAVAWARIRLDDDHSGKQVWQIVNIWMASSPFRRLLDHPKILADIAQLTEARELRVWHDQIQYKPAAQGGVNSWHQDAPAWPVLRPMTQVTAWVALDDVDESNGCMSMVPGSHGWGDSSEFLHHLPSFDAMPTSFEGHQVRVLTRPVRKGEVHYHHALTWHGSHENRSGRPRRAIAVHYMPDGTRFIAAGEHPIKRLIEVADGDAIEGTWFPVCYRRPVAEE